MLVQGVLHQDPFTGHLFVFRGRTRANLIRIIYWDGTGFCLFTKRLEHGVFLWPEHRARRDAVADLGTVVSADRRRGLALQLRPDHQPARARRCGLEYLGRDQYRPTTITAPASQIEAGLQDNDPGRAGVQNQNIRDYLATDGDSHPIGAVHFGPDGYLYVTVGDGSSYNFADPRAVRVQDIHNLSGKLLRIDPTTGEGVPGNPYYQATDPNSNQSKVFDYGVRNAGPRRKRD